MNYFILFHFIFILFYYFIFIFLFMEESKKYCTLGYNASGQNAQRLMFSWTATQRRMSCCERISLPWWVN